jgi:hypothetical protein
VVSITIKDQGGNPIKYGSGVAIGVDLIATCYHVIEGASSITVNFADGKSVTAYGIQAANKAVDLALISADTAHGYLATPQFILPNLGANVVAIGCPEGLEGTVSSGIVSSVRKGETRTLIQTTAPISPGSSGGALFDMNGRLVGITSNYMPDGENLNFAISADDLLSLEFGYTGSFQDVVAAVTHNSNDSPGRSTGVSAEPSYSPKPLTGFAGVFITIGDIDPKAVADGLVGADLKTSVELELRKNGIPVDDTTATHGLLEVETNMLKLSDGSYSYSIGVNLEEVAILNRPSPVKAFVETWRRGVTGYVPLDNMPSVASAEILKLVDLFANDYLAQNPKK